MSATVAHNDERQKAAQFLQSLDDARVFVRWAERAFGEAIALAPDQDAVNAAVALRSDAARLRRMTTAHTHSASGRFNPKRLRRVVIDNGKSTRRKGQ